MDLRTTALKGRGSAVRRRRQLSRSCCHLAFEDEKREANLHPLIKGTRKWVPFSVVGRGGLPNHGALARGSAVRRRRQLSRSCCQPALEDEKREANLHPLTKGTRKWVPFSVVGRGGFTNHGALARGSAIREAVAFAKLLSTFALRHKGGSNLLNFLKLSHALRR